MAVLKESTAPNVIAKTKQNFEEELKTLATKAQSHSSLDIAYDQLSVLFKASALLILAAFDSNVSQLSLSPVYGSIPSSIWHSQGVMFACILGWSGGIWLRGHLPWKLERLLPVVAIYIPMLQSYLSKLSGFIGASYGPIVTEMITLVPLLVLSVSCVADVLEGLDLSIFPKHVAEAAPGIGAYAFYRTVEYYSSMAINSKTIGHTFMHTRVGLQTVIGLLYALLSPSKLLLWILPTIPHLVFFNPHAIFSDSVVNSTLNKAGWSLLARNESVTGYISVLESLNDGFRVMRCDHSLLGGEWLHVPNGLLPGQMKVKEPIYAIFAMLEAVRLIEVPVTVPDNEAKALVIGLGIGTTPGALIAHGIDTTIVEIDPVVHDYAMKYFTLPQKHVPVIEDAMPYMDRLARTNQKFDYIVHDVFTGGAEPVDLFTVEFLANLHDALKPNGAIAINYAGDLLLPSAKIIVRTIKSIFPTCRIYREMAAPSAEVLASQGQDFTNMVIFCVKSADVPITFRQPVAADYLRSGARRAYLMPVHEIQTEIFESQGVKEGEVGLLSKNDTTRLTQWQQKSAVGHWNVMRTVLPNLVWETW